MNDTILEKSGNHDNRLKVAAIETPKNIGLARGTIVMTAIGEMAVENLRIDDRIITRSGMRALISVEEIATDCFELDFGRPEFIFANGEQVSSSTGLRLAA